MESIKSAPVSKYRGTFIIRNVVWNSYFGSGMYLTVFDVLKRFGQPGFAVRLPMYTFRRYIKYCGQIVNIYFRKLNLKEKERAPSVSMPGALSFCLLGRCFVLPMFYVFESTWGFHVAEISWSPVGVDTWTSWPETVVYI